MKKSTSKEQSGVDDKPIPQDKVVYIVLELAYFDEFLSASDVVGVFTSRQRAFKVAKDVTTVRTSSQYTFKGVVQESIIM